uniref:Copper sensory histidine kinase CusS n=1 Tax=Klebsiella pneumoniae TaxID=573 RepID=A0A8B0SSR3_KLEPN|nr:Copper sensory histidine kinase CusS [Klebsiella pneumoniae]
MIENPGKPIPEEHLSRLFDRFFIGWIHPDNEKGEGSGIGLAIVKSIVEAHHGRVQVESDVRSTRFYLIRAQTGENDPGNPMLKNKDVNDKDVISLSCSKQKPFDIISATYQEGWIASSIPGVRVRQEMNIQPSSGEINAAELVSVMELKNTGCTSPDITNSEMESYHEKNIVLASLLGFWFNFIGSGH